MRIDANNWHTWEAFGERDYHLGRFDKDENEVSVDQIDRQRVRAVVVRHLADGRTLFVQHIDPEKGERLIAFARVYIKYGGGQLRVVVVGWQRTVGGRNVKVLNYILPDGTVHSSSSDELAVIDVIGLRAVNQPDA